MRQMSVLKARPEELKKLASLTQGYLCHACPTLRSERLQDPDVRPDYLRDEGFAHGQSFKKLLKQTELPIFQL